MALIEERSLNRLLAGGSEKQESLQDINLILAAANPFRRAWTTPSTLLFILVKQLKPQARLEGINSWNTEQGRGHGLRRSGSPRILP